jgi:hypothetical protein
VIVRALRRLTKTEERLVRFPDQATRARLHAVRNLIDLLDTRIACRNGKPS